MIVSYVMVQRPQNKETNTCFKLTMVSLQTCYCELVIFKKCRKKIQIKVRLQHTCTIIDLLSINISMKATILCNTCFGIVQFPTIRFVFVSKVLKSNVYNFFLRPVILLRKINSLNNTHAENLRDVGMANIVYRSGSM